MHRCATWENMDLTPRLTPQANVILAQALQRSLQILQLPQLELAELIEEEIEKNPLLEMETRAPGFANFSLSSLPEPCAKPSLYEHLLTQVRETLEQPEEIVIAKAFIDALDERGFIPTTLPEPSVRFQAVLRVLQSFDPPGIFARSMPEAFALQLERQGLQNSLAMRIVREAFDDLLQGRYAQLKKTLQATGANLQLAIQQLARLSTRPGVTFQKAELPPIFADLRLVQRGRQWIVESMSDALPKVRLKCEYLNLQGLPPAQKETVRHFATSAKWLIRSLQRRAKFLLALSAHLVKLQTPFLNHKGPPTLVSSAALAERFGVHPSTISRALADKYIATPSGFMSLRTLAPSYDKDAPKEILQQLIECEDKETPLTDDALAQALQSAGHPVARRTIAKYRRELKIRPSSARKHAR